MTDMIMAAIDRKCSTLFYEIHEALKLKFLAIIKEETPVQVDYIEFEDDSKGSFYVSIHTTEKQDAYDPTIVNAERLIKKYIVDNAGAGMTFYFGDTMDKQIFINETVQI